MYLQPKSKFISSCVIPHRELRVKTFSELLRYNFSYCRLKRGKTRGDKETFSFFANSKRNSFIRAKFLSLRKSLGIIGHLSTCRWSFLYTRIHFRRFNFLLCTLSAPWVPERVMQVPSGRFLGVAGPLGHQFLIFHWSVGYLF